jgi:hypothetical protein
LWFGLSLLFGSEDELSPKKRKFIDPTYPIVIRESEESWKDTKTADLLQIIIHSDRTSGVVGDTIHFWATVTGGCLPYKEFRWFIISEDGSKEKIITHEPELDYTFNDPGVYCVRVEVLDDCGYEKSSDCRRITIEKPEPISLKVSVDEGCFFNLLMWSTKNANKVVIDHGIGEVKLNGELKLYNNKREVYVITASNKYDKVQKSITVNALPQPGTAVFKIYRVAAASTAELQGSIIRIQCYGNVSWAVDSPCDRNQGDNARITSTPWTKQVNIMGRDHLGLNFSNSFGYTVMMEIWINGSLAASRSVSNGSSGSLSTTY